MRQDDFIDRWRFEREIKDGYGGQVVRVSGVAEWQAMQDHVLYYEDGALHLPGQAPLRAERRYIWHFDGAEVEVQFDDGRPFHHFHAVGHAQGTAHLCGEDWYVVRYDFTQWPVWTAVWHVTGPRKDYVSHTQYERLA